MSKLVAYAIDGHELRIRPAPLERAWMNVSREHHAYRCLPMNIANGYGWELLCPSGFSARWDGLQAIPAVHVKPDLGTQAPATSHFGQGILTFHMPCIFSTEPGFDLYVTGPINRPKDGIAALTGMVETDWSPYTFTMNWIFTRSNTKIRFEQGEPYCHVFPVERRGLERIEPKLLPLSAVPDTEHQFKTWSKSRDTFNRELKLPGTQAAKDRWQKDYFRGFDALGEPTQADHCRRLRLKEFAKD